MSIVAEKNLQLAYIQTDDDDDDDEQSDGKIKYMVNRNLILQLSNQ